MQTPDHPAVIEVEHYVAKAVSSLPPAVLRFIGRSVGAPEGRAPAPDIAALLAMRK